MKVGDIVWVQPVEPRQNIPYYEAKVIKVGNKYFEVEQTYGRQVKYELETLRESGDTNYRNIVYLSEQDILDEKEFNSLSKIIRDKIDRYGKLPFTLDQLRRINNILNE